MVWQVDEPKHTVSLNDIDMIVHYLFQMLCWQYCSLLMVQGFLLGSIPVITEASVIQFKLPCRGMSPSPFSLFVCFAVFSLYPPLRGQACVCDQGANIMFVTSANVSISTITNPKAQRPISTKILGLPMV